MISSSRIRCTTLLAAILTASNAMASGVPKFDAVLLLKIVEEEARNKLYDQALYMMKQSFGDLSVLTGENQIASDENASVNQIVRRTDAIYETHRNAVTLEATPTADACLIISAGRAAEKAPRNPARLAADQQVLDRLVPDTNPVAQPIILAASAPNANLSAADAEYVGEIDKALASGKQQLLLDVYGDGSARPIDDLHAKNYESTDDAFRGGVALDLLRAGGEASGRTSYRHLQADTPFRAKREVDYFRTRALASITDAAINVTDRARAIHAAGYVPAAFVLQEKSSGEEMTRTTIDQIETHWLQTNRQQLVKKIHNLLYRMQVDLLESKNEELGLLKQSARLANLIRTS